MPKTWFKDWFADERYLALYCHRNTEEASPALDLIERATGISKDAAILDLACGAGRHSISLAKRGYSNITGIDLSPTLIREARKNAEAEKVKVVFFEQDMRSFDGSYDLIINLFTSFGYFATDQENEEVVIRAGKCLKNGGYFVLDFFNSAIVKRDIVAHDEKIISSGERIEQSREIRNDRVDKTIIIHSERGASEFKESVRLFELGDFEKMVSRAGLRLLHTFGDYYGAPFDEGISPRLFLVAKKDG